MALRNRRNSVSKSIDYGVLLIYLSLLVVGWFTLYASVHQVGDTMSVFDFSTPIGKHTTWLGIALVVLVATLAIDWQLWNTFAYPAYVGTLLLLALVLLFGSEIKGARSWFSFAGMSIQPSEFAKFGTLLALSSYLSHYSIDLRQRQSLLSSLGIMGAPMVLILLQPDAGSAIVFLSFFILFYIKGLSPTYYLAGGSLIAIFILSLMYSPVHVVILALIVGLVTLLVEWLDWRYISGILVSILIGWYLSSQQDWSEAFAISLVGTVGTLSVWQLLQRNRSTPYIVLIGNAICALLAFGSSLAFHSLLKPHQQDRINVWLRPDKCDPQGSLYNVLQSKLAIGSGGWTGKGHLNGTLTKLNYVPEQSTDFIFSIVGEEQGFLGVSFVIILFVILLIRIVRIAERGKTPFIKCYAYGVAGLFFVHVVVNIGMSVGLMPIIGIPLPFLSKGGSALITFSLMLGVLLRMDLARHRR